MSDRVLVSAHRRELAEALGRAFRTLGYEADLVPDPSELDPSKDPVLLVLTGERKPGEALTWIAASGDKLGIPVFTALSGADAVDRGRRAGAEEAFPAEADPEEVALLGHRAIQRRSLQRATGIVGESDPIREVLERVVQIAPVDSTVLITGESGTGKELVARGIHALSPRRHRGFLAVNVSAVAESLLESELFGHEKGAFTGAIDSRKGFFELANKGTLFLDEIGEMPLPTQTKLLRVLEQREFLRVGGERAIQVDVRIVAATNQDLRESVRLGRFRRDLYYRLNILGIELPPLRHRREDIPRLIRHFVREFSRSMDRPFPGLSGEAMELLVRYDWPGNVRELRNLVESMVVLAPGREIGPGDIPREIRSPNDPPRFLPAVRHLEGAGQVVEGVGFRPELEFLFRTMVELKVDVDQLRKEFDVYRERAGRGTAGHGEAFALPASVPGVVVGTWGVGGAPASAREPVPEPDGLVFRPGMTMEELEKEAIQKVLRELGGNRRKAAASLGIGERTLYRKILKYEIQD